jgi:cbb3-type cytochrome oxidase maturation protein
MNSLVFLIPIALVFGVVALLAFLWSLKSGQYEDLDGAAVRVFLAGADDRSGAGPDTQPRNEGAA